MLPQKTTKGTKVIKRSFCAWVHLYNQRLSVALAGSAESYSVSAGKHQSGATASTEAATARWSWGRCWTQIPDPAVHAGGGRKRFGCAYPKCRDVQCVWIYRSRFVFTRILANHFARRIEYLDRQWTTRICLQVIIDHRAVWRIFRERFVARHRCSVVVAGSQKVRVRWLEQIRTRFRNVRGALSQRCDVVDHPKTAAVCGHDQIVIVNDQIAHRRRRQVEL